MNEWNTLSLEHRWVYDKLLVATASGYPCGPMGIPVPAPGNYVIRPIINISGMGSGSRVEYLNTCDTPNEPGYFWAELLIGDHLSVDYEHGVPTLVLRGDHHPMCTTQFSSWVRLNKSSAPMLPPVIQDVCNQYPHFNAEFINGNVIEVHCREGGDSWIFDDETVVSIIPVWEGDSLCSTDEFVSSPETACVARLGFKIVRDNTLID